MAWVRLGQIFGNPLGQFRCLPFIARLEGGLAAHFDSAFGPGVCTRRFNYGDGQKLVKDMIFDHRIGTQRLLLPFKPG
jgi:hypothetical protein